MMIKAQKPWQSQYCKNFNELNASCYTCVEQDVFKAKTCYKGDN